MPQIAVDRVYGAKRNGFGFTRKANSRPVLFRLCFVGFLFLFFAGIAVRCSCVVLHLQLSSNSNGYDVRRISFQSAINTTTRVMDQLQRYAAAPTKYRWMTNSTTTGLFSFTIAFLLINCVSAFLIAHTVCHTQQRKQKIINTQHNVRDVLEEIVVMVLNFDRLFGGNTHQHKSLPTLLRLYTGIVH